MEVATLLAIPPNLRWCDCGLGWETKAFIHPAPGVIQNELGNVSRFL